MVSGNTGTTNILYNTIIQARSLFYFKIAMHLKSIAIIFGSPRKCSNFTHYIAFLEESSSLQEDLEWSDWQNGSQKAEVRYKQTILNFNKIEGIFNRPKHWLLITRSWEYPCCLLPDYTVCYTSIISQYWLIMHTLQTDSYKWLNM